MIGYVETPNRSCVKSVQVGDRYSDLGEGSLARKRLEKAAKFRDKCNDLIDFRKVTSLCGWH